MQTVASFSCFMYKGYNLTGNKYKVAQAVQDIVLQTIAWTVAKWGFNALYIISYVCKWGLLRWRSREEVGFSNFSAWNRFVLPTFQSCTLAFFRAKIKLVQTLSFKALHLSKCCHWNYQLAPQASFCGLFWFTVLLNAAIQHPGSSRAPSLLRDGWLS